VQNELVTVTVCNPEETRIQFSLLITPVRLPISLSAYQGKFLIIGDGFEVLTEVAMLASCCCLVCLLFGPEGGGSAFI
jgi:hypothetical protein